MRPRTVDRLLAAVLAVAAVFEVVIVDSRKGPLVANVALALLYTLPLVWRRTHLYALLACVLGAALAMAVFFTPMQDLFVPLLVILIVAYSCGARQDARHASLSVVLIAAGMIAVMSTMPDQRPSDFFFPTMFMVMSWLAGRAIHSRTRLTEALHEAAAQAAEEHDDEVRRAAAEERRRIAREMHDLVAHSMSVMVVQAGGARRILDRDPARALEAAERIERTGREALAEMRHLLGVLHEGEERADRESLGDGSGPEPRALAPQPTLAELDALIARARAAGLPVVLHEDGERRPLPAGLDLAAYRIVQEALTNALKYSGGAATEVTVTWGATELAVEVRDRGRVRVTGDGGHGLVGMRERVRVYGGELETGPAKGGGWRVRATLPLVREMALT
jgi:signal transduction histidine kinase